MFYVISHLLLLLALPVIVLLLLTKKRCQRGVWSRLGVVPEQLHAIQPPVIWIHAASLGGVWQCVVHGFAGVKEQDDILSINPKLPQTWKKIKCTLLRKKALIKIESSNNEVRINIESKQKKKLIVKVFEKTYALSKNKVHTFHKPSLLQKHDYY